MLGEYKSCIKPFINGMIAKLKLVSFKDFISYIILMTFILYLYENILEKFLYDFMSIFLFQIQLKKKVNILSLNPNIIISIIFTL